MATPILFQAVFPWVAKIAPTTSGIQATRASLFTLGETLPVRDVSEGCVNPSPASVSTPEAGDYRPRRSAAKPPEHRQGQRDQKPRQRRAAREHDLSKPRTRLYSKDGSGQPSTHGAEETSPPAGLHAFCGHNVGEGCLPNLRSGGSRGTRRCCSYRGISRFLTSVADGQTASHSSNGVALSTRRRTRSGGYLV